ncbi:MAG: PepSY domain-containing protein, partial [Opitutaceae bacterium]
MFRKILFWSHLVAGLISGIAIGVMCFTGTALAFEKQLIAWSERDARMVGEPAPGAARLSLEEIQAKLRTAKPEARPASLVLLNDPRAAIAFPAGRAAGFYVDPFTGEVRQPQSVAM